MFGGNSRVNRDRNVTPFNASNQIEPHHSDMPCVEHTSIDKRRMRLLSKRYALTPTGYKYVEIGINVGPSSYVEIALGDNRGHELILSLETWKGLLENRQHIEQCFQKFNHGQSARLIYIGPLTVRFTWFNDVALMQFELSNVRLMMTEATFIFMCKLDFCVDIWFNYCVRFTDEVDSKFGHFCNIMSTVNGSNTTKINAIYNSEHFQQEKLIDCELLALLSP